MKKLIGLLFLVGHLAFGLNFYGVNSINGLNGVQVFAAPATGTYFVNGQLNLALLSQNGNTLASGAFVVISKNGAYFNPTVKAVTPLLLYTGLGGQTGFQLNQISLVTGDTITAQMFSTISGSGIQGAGDASSNALSGQIYFGNTF